MFFVVIKSIPDAGNAMKAEASINEGQGTKDVKIAKELVSFIRKKSYQCTNKLEERINMGNSCLFFERKSLFYPLKNSLHLFQISGFDAQNTRIGQ